MALEDDKFWIHSENPLHHHYAIVGQFHTCEGALAKVQSELAHGAVVVDMRTPEGKRRRWLAPERSWSEVFGTKMI